jgi:streptogramin lyase
MSTLFAHRPWLLSLTFFAACAGPHGADSGALAPSLAASPQLHPDSIPGIVEIASVPASPYGIAPDPSGNEWIAGDRPAILLSINEVSHTKSRYNISGPYHNPDWVALGRNHDAMWFNDPGANKIGFIRFSTHTIREFAVPGGTPALDITAGPDNAMWFTETVNSKIGRISMANYKITDYTVPGSVDPEGITLGPDGNLWFTEYNANKIGRITTTGHNVTQYALPHASSYPLKITSGPDGALWFTEFSSVHGRVGRIDPATHIISEWNVPSATSGPFAIVARDNQLWFTERAGNIGRIDASTHVITEYAVPTAHSGPTGIALGSDNQLWFTQSSSNQIGKLCPGRSTQHCASSN